MERSWLKRIALVVLLAAGAYTFASIYGFSQGRFFTVDEYQFGHATWLVAQGAVPYLDFFEHHFPLSYVLHAPLFTGEVDFVWSALLLRQIVFVYWLGVGLLAGASCLAVTRNPLAALLVTFLPPSFGFLLMSGIDYRADNFGAVFFAACLLLLEWNRQRRSRTLAICSGLLAAAAAGMTQKMTFFAGGSLGLMLILDGLARFRGADHRPFVAMPGAFLASGGLLVAIGIGVAAALGMLTAGIESTIVQAALHERLYEPFSLFQEGYVTRFWSQTWPTTSAVLLFAGGFLVTRDGRFWLVPVAVSAVGLSSMAAPYPYNFVLACWLLVVAAIRGFAAFVQALEARFPPLDGTGPILYLLPLALLSSQLAFVSGTTTNEHQLRVLAKIEKYGQPTDGVIDNAGGAMFSPGATYYFHHGKAHRALFRDYFETNLVEDYRRSQALFWIWDMRFRGLPKPARDYLRRHYIHGGDGLHVLGIRTPSTEHETQRFVFDVVRPGEYRVHPSQPGSARSNTRDHDLTFDGTPLVGDRIQLDLGEHLVEVLPGAPEYVVSLLDPSFFDADPVPARYSMMFEYREPATSQVRTHFSAAEHLDEVARDGRARLGPGDTLEQQPGSVLRFRLEMPEEPRLRGHARLLGGVGAKPGENGRLVISIESGALRNRLVSQRLTEPMRQPGLKIDSNLARYAGRSTEVTITFDAPSNDAHRIRWTGLRIDGLEETLVPVD